MRKLELIVTGLWFPAIVFLFGRFLWTFYGIPSGLMPEWLW